MEDRAAADARDSYARVVDVAATSPARETEDGAPARALAPRPDRETMQNELWAMARVPGHALAKLSDAEVGRTYDDVKTRLAAGPGKHELKVGSHTLKMTVGPDGQVTESSTKKPGVVSRLATVGKAALTVASFVPGPVGIAARVANGVIGAVQAVRSKNLLGAVGAAAGAVGAGVAGFGSQAMAGVARVSTGASQAIRGAQGLRQGGIGGVISGATGIASGALAAVGDRAASAAAQLDRLSLRLAPVGAVESYARARHNVERAEGALAAAQARGDHGAVMVAQAELDRARRGRTSALLGAGASVAGAASSVTGHADPTQGRTGAQLGMDVASRGLGVARSLNDRDFASAATGALGVASDVRHGTRARDGRFDPLRASAEVADRLNGTRLARGSEQHARALVDAAEGGLARARASGDPQAIREAQAQLDRARRARSDASLSTHYASDGLARTVQDSVTSWRQTRAADRQQREETERAAAAQRRREEQAAAQIALADGAYAELEAVAKNPRAVGGFQTIAAEGLALVRDKKAALDDAVRAGDDAAIARASRELDAAREGASERARTLTRAFEPAPLSLAPSIIPDLGGEVVITRRATASADPRTGRRSAATPPPRPPTPTPTPTVAGAPPPKPPTPVRDVLAANFDRWDTDGDRFLTSEEVDRAMLDPRNRGEQAAALGALKRQVGNVAALSNDEWGYENSGLTRNDLAELTRGGPGAVPIARDLDGWYQHNLGRLDRARPSAVFASGTPRVDAIGQGAIGDCYFLAAVGSQVASDPESVRRMISSNTDGTYTVRFPGRAPVRVAAPTEAETAYYGSSGRDGQWLAILEKGYGQVRNDRSWFSTTTIPQDAADGGAQLSEGIASLTGRPTHNDLLSATAASVTRENIASALADRRIVTTATPPGSGMRGGIPLNHAYSVIGYDRRTDTITLRNPWGRTEVVDSAGKPRDGVDDGRFTISMAEFTATFYNVTYERR